MTAAIVGTGFMARTHAEALARIGVLVAGVVGSRTVEYAHTYDSFDEMLDDPRVDIVHICSPNHMHFEQAMACLQAGKHVVCEKPLAMSSSQAHMLSAAATELGLVNAVCFLSRFYPLCQEAAARSVGDVRLVTGNYLQDWLSEDTDWNWRLDPAVGGPLRVVGDIGSHWLDLVGFVTGQRVEAVMADLTTVLPVRQGSTVTTEDMAGVLLRFDGGARGVLTLSQVSPGRKNHLSFEVSGSEASLAWNSENPDQLWTGHRSSPNQLELRSAGDYPAGHAMGYPDAFKALFRAVYDGGEYPTFEDGLEQVLIGEAIAESARLGQWATVQR
ncbi:Gfo/Idh/MocA family oxidoreductase [Mycobacterium sp. 236(2023)]|uniref:Gfo/Idh/MocA family protein n=1 Tax=Mycobacterium sp. 236(2023) TaxID=3038163 RepID=UPI00241527F1|nr:Gfo/Idh/MocA family oxidoreductase [Mycobacterium sp. 236(2023)]MDG4663685.1 Gfo/Idh/MocA family oxidoreductase [Mycobacterium sp. 236(2023)]